MAGFALFFRRRAGPFFGNMQQFCFMIKIATASLFLSLTGRQDVQNKIEKVRTEEQVGSDCVKNVIELTQNYNNLQNH